MIEFIFAITVIGGIYWVRRAVKALELAVDHYGKKEISGYRVFGPVESGTSQSRPDIKERDRVPELPPETIAPNLKTPPRSAGFGFTPAASDDAGCDPPPDGKPAKKPFT